MNRRPPRSTLDRSSAASDGYKRQRQLQSEVLRAAVLAEDVIRGEHLTVTAEVRAPSGGHTGLDLRNAVEDVERAMVLQLSLIHISEPTRPY